MSVELMASGMSSKAPIAHTSQDHGRGDGVLLPHSLLVLTFGEERERVVVAVAVVVVATGC